MAKPREYRFGDLVLLNDGHYGICMNPMGSNGTSPVSLARGDGLRIIVERSQIFEPVPQPGSEDVAEETVNFANLLRQRYP